MNFLSGPTWSTSNKCHLKKLLWARMNKHAGERSGRVKKISRVSLLLRYEEIHVRKKVDTNHAVSLATRRRCTLWLPSSCQGCIESTKILYFILQHNTTFLSQFLLESIQDSHHHLLLSTICLGLVYTCSVNSSVPYLLTSAYALMMRQQ